MNKRQLLLFALVLAGFWLQAQGPGRDRIKTLKVAFITERVGLTTKEAQSFWPIYNEHEEKIQTIRHKERMEIRSRISAAEELTDADSSDLLDKLLALEDEKHDAERDFIAKIRKVIPPKKVLLLIKAEEDFKKRLLQQYRKRGGGE